MHYCDHVLSVLCPLSLTFHIFDFSSETADRNSTKLDGSRILTSSTKFVFFGQIGNTRWPPRTLIGVDIFNFSSETASTKLDGSRSKFVFFGPIKKNKMAGLTSDWLRHFWLRLWNRRRELNKTWQEARSQRPLPTLYFSGQNKQATLASDWPRHFRLLLWGYAP